jgi:hypothetical protein
VCCVGDSQNVHCQHFWEKFGDWLWLESKMGEGIKVRMHAPCCVEENEKSCVIAYAFVRDLTYFNGLGR